MTTINPDEHLKQLCAERSRLEAAIADLDQRISTTRNFISMLETPWPAPPDPASPGSDSASGDDGPKQGKSSDRGPKARDHQAVKALRADDLRPYRRYKQDVVTLALRYAFLHDGEIDMKGLVPLAIRLGVCRAEYYKNAWGAVYRPLERSSQFVSAGKGRLVVVPDSDETEEADAA